MKESYEPGDFILCHPRTYWIDPQKLVLIQIFLLRKCEFCMKTSILIWKVVINNNENNLGDLIMHTYGNQILLLVIMNMDIDYESVNVMYVNLLESLTEFVEELLKLVILELLKQVMVTSQKIYDRVIGVVNMELLKEFMVNKYIHVHWLCLQVISTKYLVEYLTVTMVYDKIYIEKYLIWFMVELIHIEKIDYFV
eukprot:432474_1